MKWTAATNIEPSFMDGIFHPPRDAKSSSVSPTLCKFLVNVLNYFKAFLCANFSEVKCALVLIFRFLLVCNFMKMVLLEKMENGDLVEPSFRS